MTETTSTDLHYPAIPPMMEGESSDQYTDRLTGADGGTARPYNHRRYRQCSIGYHSECSQRTNGTTIGAGGDCECPHHTDPRLAAALPHVASFAFHMTGETANPDRLREIENYTVDVVVDMLAAMDRKVIPA